jgi:two-component system, OmpR family, sensor histidine kinase MprB
MSLRTRIAAVAGVAVAVTVLIAAVSVYFAVRSSLRGEVEDALAQRAEAPRPGPAFGRPGAGAPIPNADGDGQRPGPPPGVGGPPGIGGPPPEFAPPPRDEEFGGAGGYVQRVAPDGDVDRPPNETAELPVEGWALAIARSGRGREIRDMTVDGTHLMVLTEGIGADGAIQVARPLTEVDNVLDDVLLALVLVGAGGIALAALLGAVVARAALEPVARFTRRTEAIAATPDIAQRMDVVGRDELARLAQSFNTTLDALERAVESQRQLVADASHELRTPIASLRANIQTLEEADRLPAHDLAALRQDIIAELDELTALVSDVVELARGTPADEALDDVRLHAVVDAAVERAQRRAGDGVKYELKLEPTVVRGEPDRVARAVTNLLDNARKFSPNGGAIEVELRDGTLSVRDHGPGFAEEDLPHVFDRFYRSKGARGMPGSGLGLAIVRQAAEARGGSVEAANAPGGGALMRVRFESDTAS